MAKLVWRYSDDARAIIENVYKFYMEVKKSGRTLSLNFVWDRTAALTGVSRSTAEKIVEEKKTAHDEQQLPKHHRHLPSKVSLADFDQGVVRRAIAKMYCLKKVLPTHDNIRTELKQSIGYWQQGSSSQRSPSNEVCLHTLWGGSKSADGENKDVVLSRIRCLRRVRESREAGFTVVYT